MAHSSTTRALVKSKMAPTGLNKIWASSSQAAWTKNSRPGKPLPRASSKILASNKPTVVFHKTSMSTSDSNRRLQPNLCKINMITLYSLRPQTGKITNSLTETTSSTNLAKTSLKKISLPRLLSKALSKTRYPSRSKKSATSLLSARAKTTWTSSLSHLSQW